MNESKYSVWIKDSIVAKEMILADALLLVRALMENYYSEPKMEIIIKRE